MKKTNDELHADFEEAFSALSASTGISMSIEVKNRYFCAINFLRNYALEAVLDLSVSFDDVDKFSALLDVLNTSTSQMADLAFVSQMAKARWMVDSVAFGFSPPCDPYNSGLSIDQLAFLSGLKPQSVRNLQVKDSKGNPKNSDGLKTVVINGQTLVDAETAYHWLLARKGYVRTNRISANNKGRDFDKAPFVNLIDLGNYLFEIRRDGKSELIVGKPGSDLDKNDFAVLCKKLELTDEWAGIFAKLEQGECRQFDEEFSVAMEGLFVFWADAHQIDAEQFVFAVLALHEKLRRIKVRQRVENERWVYRQPSKLPFPPQPKISIEKIMRNLDKKM